MLSENLLHELDIPTSGHYCQEFRNASIKLTNLYISLFFSTSIESMADTGNLGRDNTSQCSVNGPRAIVPVDMMNRK
jgi:hypothetical protein